MRTLLTLAAAAVCAAGALAVPAAAAQADPAGTAPTGATVPADACAGTVQIQSLTFNPPRVVAGQVVRATAVGQNCTAQQQQVSTAIYGRFVGSTPGIPTGCPALPSLPGWTVTVDPGATFSWQEGYHVPSGCTATGLQVTVWVEDDATGGELTQTATVPIDPPPAAPCTVSYRTGSEWPGGFTAQITIKNTSTVPVNGWTLGFTFPGDQHIDQSWSATAQQSGATVTARNASYNPLVAPGASVVFGVLGTWQASDAVPIAFTLNNVSCAAG
ncbi:cellulose-binding domain-containing protein [Micromonospora sp. NPDC049274]|uniref:cellulose-binding domain-containing protein n=1 Tax=Micromonospora sp. NPDC049274 TaxID=3154829 RepID=UPI00342F1916